MAAHHEAPSSGVAFSTARAKIGVDRVHLVLREHVLHEQESGFVEKVGGVVGAFVEPELLVEREWCAVAPAQFDVATAVDRATVERGTEDGVPRAERVIRSRISVDARADHEAEGGASFAEQVGKRLGRERHAEIGAPVVHHFDRVAVGLERPRLVADGDRDWRESEARRVVGCSFPVARERVGPRVGEEAGRIGRSGHVDGSRAGVDAHRGCPNSSR